MSGAVELAPRYHYSTVAASPGILDCQLRIWNIIGVTARIGLESTRWGDMKYQIEAMATDDWAQVSAIYTEGLATGLATFETQVPSWERWNEAHLEVRDPRALPVATTP